MALAASTDSPRLPFEYHHFRLLRDPNINSQLLDVQLERLAELDQHIAHCPAGLPIFTVIAPGVLAVTFKHDSPALAALGPTIFQLRGRGEVAWAAASSTPGWRLRELKWYADELSLLDTSDADTTVDCAYEPMAAERVRARRVTGPSPRILCSPEPKLEVVGKGRYLLTFPSHSGAPAWWSHPISIEIGDEITIEHNEETPRWRFDEIREYVMVLADIHLEALTVDPERQGTLNERRRHMGNLRRSTWSSRLSRMPSRANSLAGQMDNLNLEPIPPTNPRRSSEPTAIVVSKQSHFTEEPFQEAEAAVRCEIVGHGVFDLTWFKHDAMSRSDPWQDMAARVQLFGRGALVDLHKDTPSEVRRELIAAAVDLHIRLTSIAAEVTTVFSLSMPRYPMLEALLPSPHDTNPGTLPPPHKSANRVLIEVHSHSTPTVAADDLLPRLVLHDPPANIFRLASTSPCEDDPIFDLTSVCGPHSHLRSISLDGIDRQALYLYALKELIGISEKVPPCLLDMLGLPDPTTGRPVRSPPPSQQIRNSCSPAPRFFAEPVGIGTLDVTFPTHNITVRVFFVTDAECVFELSQDTSVTCVSELGPTLEHSLRTELHAWWDIKAIVRRFAPNLPPGALDPVLPELLPGRARLRFTPHAGRAPLSSGMPRLTSPYQGKYEVEWALDHVGTTTYEIRGGHVNIVTGSALSNSLMVVWLGVVLKDLFETRHAAPRYISQDYAAQANTRPPPLSFPLPHTSPPSSANPSNQSPSLPQAPLAHRTLPTNSTFPTPHPVASRVQYTHGPTGLSVPHGYRLGSTPSPTHRGVPPSPVGGRMTSSSALSGGVPPRGMTPSPGPPPHDARLMPPETYHGTILAPRRASRHFDPPSRHSQVFSVPPPRNVLLPVRQHQAEPQPSSVSPPSPAKEIVHTHVPNAAHNVSYLRGPTTLTIVPGPAESYGQ